MTLRKIYHNMGQRKTIREKSGTFYAVLMSSSVDLVLLILLINIINLKQDLKIKASLHKNWGFNLMVWSVNMNKLVFPADWFIFISNLYPCL